MTDSQCGTPHLWFGASLSSASSVHNFVKCGPVRNLAVGKKHCGIVSLNGCALTFGNNQYGQLGLGHTQDEFKECCAIDTFKGDVLLFSFISLLLKNNLLILVSFKFNWTT